MKNTHHHRDHTTTHRTHWVHLSNSRGFLTDMSPYLTKQESIYSVILPIYNVAYNRASVFSLQIFLSPLSPAPLEVLIAAYCCFATPSLSTPAMSTPAFLTVPRCPLPRFQSPLQSLQLCRTRQIVHWVVKVHKRTYALFAVFYTTVCRKMRRI